MGFVDVSGTLGRRFGSLGLALDEIVTRVRLAPSDSIEVTGPSATRAAAYLHRLIDHYDVCGDVGSSVVRGDDTRSASPGGVHLTVESAIPEHVGLGSGTQLALTVAKAFGARFGFDVSTEAVASQLDRGARSGIGIGAFEQGGFVIDGGRAPAGGYPPVIARMAFPASWRVLLVFDYAGRGLSGAAEQAAFRRLQQFPQSSAAHLAHLVLLRVMPALVEADFAAFSAGIGEIQRTVGDHFAAAQNGRYGSSAVTQALTWLEAQGLAGVGQTSWGPTGFAIVDSEVAAHALMLQARQRFAHLQHVGFAVVRARNRGYALTVIEAGGQAERHAGRAAERKTGNT